METIPDFDANNDIDDIIERNPEHVKDLLDYDYSDIEPRKFGHTLITVEKDSTGKSETTGTQKDYIDLFQDRFDKMKSLLSGRRYENPKVKIHYLEEKGGEDVTVIGMVQEMNNTRNDNKLVVLDDTTGSFAFIATDEEIKQEMEDLMPDEVIAIEGQVADDGGIVFINKVHKPEVSRNHTSEKANRSVNAVFISDIHVGAENFAVERWHAFVDWVRTTPEIGYIVVGGDLVEGVGIFPDQEDELSLTQLDHQYRMVGELFYSFPEDVEIVMCTGNHDAVRLAEPQPALREEHQAYFPDNVTFVSNPARVVLDDFVSVEMYHGVAIHDFTGAIPEADENEPEVPMRYMLDKRHLSPIFGNNARIAPEKTDYHVLEEVPDILHAGHVHTFGTDTYRDVSILNTGGWVYQTAYQERMNIDPTVGKIAYMDLSTQDIQVKQF